jgi:hypothetical protein
MLSFPSMENKPSFSSSKIFPIQSRSGPIKRSAVAHSIRAENWIVRFFGVASRLDCAIVGLRVDGASYESTSGQLGIGIEKEVDANAENGISEYLPSYGCLKAIGSARSAPNVPSNFSDVLNSSEPNDVAGVYL